LHATLPASVVVVVVLVVMVTVVDGIAVVLDVVVERIGTVLDDVVGVAGTVVGGPGSVVGTAKTREATKRSRPRRRAVMVPASSSQEVSTRPRSCSRRSVPQVFQRATTFVPFRVALTRPRIGEQMGSIDTLLPWTTIVTSVCPNSPPEMA
jgi:hypothetical protein